MDITLSIGLVDKLCDKIGYVDTLILAILLNLYSTMLSPLELDFLVGILLTSLV